MGRCFPSLVSMLVLGALASGCIASAKDPAAPESTRSAPPDTTPYVRPAVPEDSAPFGKPAIGSEVVPKGRDITKKSPSSSPPPDANLEEKK
jgi:hypothetical protein